MATTVAPTWFADYTNTGLLRHVGAAAYGSSSVQSATALTAASSNQFDWIVQFKPAAIQGIASAQATASLLAGGGISFDVVCGLGLPGEVLVRSSGSAPAAVRSWLGRNSSVAAYEMDAVRQALAVSDDPRLPQQWALENSGSGGGRADADIDAQDAWSLSTGSRSVVVGVLDTGVDYTHPDLAANVWANPGEIAGNGRDDDANGFVDDVHGYDFLNRDGDPMDDNNHGTHVAGTIAAAGNNGIGVAGINWAGSVMALKFLDARGAGYTSDAVRAVNYATMMRDRYGVNVRVLNCSWGGAVASTALAAAMQSAGAAGILTVAAAGNAGKNADVSPAYPAAFAAESIVSVAASNRSDELAAFSNYGASGVDLAAPGVAVLSTVRGGRYASFSGTSMAAPQVAGTAALAWAVAPAATVAEIRTAILQGADDLPALAGKVASGGRLNAYTTLTLITHQDPGTPRVASLAAPSSPLPAGAMATFTASGISDPDGAGALAGVWFYEDANGNGQWDGNDRLLGVDRTISAGEASLTASTAGYAEGRHVIFAVAQDIQAHCSTAAAAVLEVLAADDHGDSAAAATRIGEGQTLAAKIGVGGDHDWFAVDLSAGRGYVFETTLRGLVDSVMSLYGQDGSTSLVRDDDGGTARGSRIAWTVSRSGTYFLEVTAYGAGQTGDYALRMEASGGTAGLTTIPDTTLSARNGPLRLTLATTDANGLPLSYAAQLVMPDALAQRAYELESRLNLRFTGQYSENRAGAGEKYLVGEGGAWYYLLPNGELHAWGGSLAASPLVDTLSPAYYANPALLYDAVPPTQSATTADLAVSVQGNMLTLTARSGFAGSAQVRVITSNGRAPTTQTFRVTVI